MYHMLHDPHFFRNHSKHKMTTDKQYSVLKSSMAHFLLANKNSLNKITPNGTIKYKQNHSHWTELTEKLNKMGPPYRTIQEWKKVWCDFQRSERKRKIKNKLLLQRIKNEPIYESETSQAEMHESILGTTTSEENKMHIKSERDNEQNSQSIYSTYSNEYDNDYSYPDEEASLQGSYADENVKLLPDESSSGSQTYAARCVNETEENQRYSSPPPLQPANLPMLNQTLYTLENQMEHQTKLLEHMSQMSSTMAGLMERQADAVEKQTEAMHRQALATERHTSIMNRFLGMIREKMFKGNSQNHTASTDNSSDDIL